MINLEIPRKFTGLVNQAHQVGAEILRPISRRYDRLEHTRPKELDMLGALLDGMNASGEGGSGAAGVRGGGKDTTGGNHNGTNLSTVLGIIELCWGDVGLLLAMPNQGLGNAAIASVADEAQLKRFGHLWASMAITEPRCGSDSAAIATTAILDGDEYVLNGEKIFVTAGERSEAVVVWATLNRSLGRAAIKSFVVEKGTPGLTIPRLEHKLGIRASDTATLLMENCRVPKENLLGSPEIQTDRGFAGAMQTFDNTRPLVAGMAVGLARAALEETARILTGAGIDTSGDGHYDAPPATRHAAAAAFLDAEANWEAARLLTLQASWMADNGKANSLQASMAKAKAGRTATAVTLLCAELCGSIGYSEHDLLEKWCRDAKILDIFEGTQHIQQLVIARRLLNKTSAELR